MPAERDGVQVDPALGGKIHTLSDGAIILANDEDWCCCEPVCCGGDAPSSITVALSDINVPAIIAICKKVIPESLWGPGWFGGDGWQGGLTNYVNGSHCCDHKGFCSWDNTGWGKIKSHRMICGVSDFYYTIVYGVCDVYVWYWPAGQLHVGVNVGVLVWDAYSGRWAQGFAASCVDADVTVTGSNYCQSGITVNNCDGSPPSCEQPIPYYYSQLENGIWVQKSDTYNASEMGGTATLTPSQDPCPNDKDVDPESSHCVWRIYIQYDYETRSWQIPDEIEPQLLGCWSNTTNLQYEDWKFIESSIKTVTAGNPPVQETHLVALFAKDVATTECVDTDQCRTPPPPDGPYPLDQDLICVRYWSATYDCVTKTWTKTDPEAEYGGGWIMFSQDYIDRNIVFDKWVFREDSSDPETTHQTCIFDFWRLGGANPDNEDCNALYESEIAFPTDWYTNPFAPTVEAAEMAKCPCSVECPEDCPDCAGSYTVWLSGTTNGWDGSASAPRYGGTTVCVWSDVTQVSIACVDGKWRVTLHYPPHYAWYVVFEAPALGPGDCPGDHDDWTYIEGTEPSSSITVS